MTVVKADLADIEEAMKDVVDPELGINVVDLGLVYGVHVDDDNVVTLDMTLTSAACPLTDVIEDQARQALCTGPGGGLASDVRINWVWMSDPYCSFTADSWLASQGFPTSDGTTES
jgi:metal-sulfur cluster biosynthetic enzyme